jgi:homoserine kinase
VNNSVRIEVPASTSNLGSGFDTLGLALQLRGTVHAVRQDQPGLRLIPGSAGQSDVLSALLDEARRHFFRRTRARTFGVAVAVDHAVPVGRGLGASAIARVGLLAGLDALAHTHLSRSRLLELATELEGHPDNASPAIFGGFTVSGRIGRGVRCLWFPVNPRWKFVTLIPRFEMPTGTARRLLPNHYSRPDAAHSLNRAALITAAFARADLASLRGVFDDRLHQPYREKLIPPLRQVIRAGERAGAVGGFLSGAGSAIICVTAKNAQAVAQEMQRRLPDSEIMILSASPTGYRVTRADRPSK